MLSPKDIIQIPYTPDLSQAGISYTCRWLACTSEHVGDSLIEQLRGIIAGVAAELAFRRHLTAQKVPFQVLDSAPFTHPGEYQVLLGGHRCRLQTQFIHRSHQVAQLQRESGSLLRESALVPVEELQGDGHSPEDLYVFAFLLGKAAAGQREITQALAAGQPVTLIHPLPGKWRSPAHRLPREALLMKSECETPLDLELGGLDDKRNFLNKDLTLAPHMEVRLPPGFTSLAYVCAKSLPGRRLTLHNPVHGETYIIKPYDWGNIGIQGGQILLAGWLTHEEFRHNARGQISGSPSVPKIPTPFKNTAVPVGELHPLEDLFKRVLAWKAEFPA